MANAEPNRRIEHSRRVFNETGEARYDVRLRMRAGNKTSQALKSREILVAGHSKLQDRAEATYGDLSINGEFAKPGRNALSRTSNLLASYKDFIKISSKHNGIIPQIIKPCQL